MRKYEEEAGVQALIAAGGGVTCSTVGADLKFLSCLRGN